MLLITGFAEQRLRSNPKFLPLLKKQRGKDLSKVCGWFADTAKREIDNFPVKRLQIQKFGFLFKAGACLKEGMDIWSKTLCHLPKDRK